MPAHGSTISTEQQQPAAETKPVEAQYLAVKEELRQATIQRAQREVENPELYWAPDALQRELVWTIHHLRQQFARLEALCQSERAALVFVGCMAGQHRFCKTTVGALRCACECHSKG